MQAKQDWNDLVRMTTPVNILAPAFCTSCKVFKSSLKCRQLMKLVKETSVHHYHLFIQEEAWIQLYPQATNMLLWGSATQSRTAFPKSQLLANTLAQAAPLLSVFQRKHWRLEVLNFGLIVLNENVTLGSVFRSY